MKRTTLLIVFTSMLLHLCISSNGEKTIPKKDVPESVRNYIAKNYSGAKKVRYYIDHTNDTVYYEVELTYKKEKLSLTFLEDGTLYELEKNVNFKSLSPQTRANIDNYLSIHYKKYKITSVQLVNPHLHTEIELSIKAKDETGSDFYEMFFNEKGEFMHMEEIVLKPIQTLF